MGSFKKNTTLLNSTHLALSDFECKSLGDTNLWVKDFFCCTMVVHFDNYLGSGIIHVFDTDVINDVLKNKYLLWRTKGIIVSMHPSLAFFSILSNELGEL